MYRLISATPSPYARKVRIQLAEKNIPFELITEVPWNSDTQTPRWNPLEKLPVLLLPDGGSVFESRYINEWIAVRWPHNPWRAEYPHLASYSEGLEERPSFAATRPVPQVIRDRVA